MTYSDEEIDAACAKFFAVELAQDHESVKDSARNSMRAALSTLTTPKVTVNENLEQARYYEAELRGLSTRDTGNGSWFDDDDARTCSNAADEVAKLCAIIAGPPLTTPKAWTPIGWNGPFRADNGCVWDRDDSLVCMSSFRAPEIASALNTACQAGAISEWRPIDDEAKSGKPVDLWLLASDGIPGHGRRIAEVKWNMDRSFNAGIGRVAQPDAWTYSHGGQVHLDGGTITHWMPAPPPPETGGRSFLERMATEEPRPAPNDTWDGDEGREGRRGPEAE